MTRETTESDHVTRVLLPGVGRVLGRDWDQIIIGINGSMTMVYLAKDTFLCGQTSPSKLLGQEGVVEEAGVSPASALAPKSS